MKASRILPFAAAAVIAAATAVPAMADTTSNVATSQSQTASLSITTDEATARLTDNVLKNAKGDMGLNVAAGVGNKQSNAAVIQGNAGGGKATLNNVTVQSLTFDGAVIGGAAETTATIGDNVGQYISGNAGINVAAGAFNQQANTLQVSAKTLAAATTGISQTGSKLGGLALSDLTAKVSDNAFQFASGHVGVNLASGIGNQQQNSLTVSK